MSTPEGRITRKIVRYLEKAGAYVVKQHGTPFGRAGVPDLLACVRGYFVAIEVKALKGKVSAIQQVQLLRICRAAGYAIVARCVEDVAEVVEAIEADRPGFAPMEADE